MTSYPHTKSSANPKQSHPTLAAQIADGWDLWHTPHGTAYATIPINGHQEHWRVESKQFKKYLSKRFYEMHNAAIGNEALYGACSIIEARAQFDGDEHEVLLRVGRDINGNVIVDLCNEVWQAVEISPTGWRVIDQSPIRFRRTPGMLALPHPEFDGTVDVLRRFLNVDDHGWRLIAAWLIAALRPSGPYPVLLLSGEHGSAKSTTARFLRSLIDPNEANLRGEQDGLRNLMVSANNSHCHCLDNLSEIPNWLSDALCRVASGGGFATRRNYSDDDEVIFHCQRPVLITSIEEVISRSDLGDRTLFASLSAIPDDMRRTEEELYHEFEQERPLILGALLDVVSGALGNVPSNSYLLPRLADFAKWVYAAEASLGWPPGTFHQTLERNRDAANEIALEASPIGFLLVEFLNVHGPWNGTSSQLIKALRNHNANAMGNGPWSKNPRSMSCHVARIVPNLRRAGWDATSVSRIWTFSRRP